MTRELPSLSSDPINARSSTRSPRTGRNPYFRMLALLAGFLLAVGVVMMLIGEFSTGGILLGVGFSALVAVLVTGAITWQIRQIASRQA